MHNIWFFRDKFLIICCWVKILLINIYLIMCVCAMHACMCVGGTCTYVFVCVFLYYFYLVVWEAFSHQTWNSSVPGFLFLCQHPCVRLPGTCHHTYFLHRCLRSKPRPSYLNRKHFTNWIISQLLNTLLIYNFTCYTYYIWCLNEIK